MSKLPSDATKLKTLRRDYADMLRKHELLRGELAGYRIRATKAEQEVAEWKRRFDALLARTPQLNEGSAK